MPWYDVFAPLPSIVSELKGIKEQLTRMADAAEGKLPNPIVVPEAEPEPASIAGASSDRDYARIEAIEQRYLVMGGRLPTEDEVVREMEGAEIPSEVLQAEFQRRQRVPDSSHGRD